MMDRELAQLALDECNDPELKASIFEFARAVVLTADQAELTIATGESITGGMVLELMTSVPGSSAVVRGGVVAYATDLKQSLLAVPVALLAKGAVQAEVAIAMAQGAADSCSADIGVGCTGVAGPTAQDGRPVGEVHIAVVDTKNNAIRSHSLMFSGTRDEIRVQTCIAIFGLLLDVLVPQSPLTRS